ncbi:hypothetical protein UES1_221 [Escherichia phage UE-S1]|nr:hypothetical protein UES1_221 [Escherichia phage UE-S1]
MVLLVEGVGDTLGVSLCSILCGYSYYVLFRENKG